MNGVRIVLRSAAGVHSYVPAEHIHPRGDDFRFENHLPAFDECSSALYFRAAFAREVIAEIDKSGHEFREPVFHHGPAKPRGGDRRPGFGNHDVGDRRVGS